MKQALLFLVACAVIPASLYAMKDDGLKIIVDPSGETVEHGMILMKKMFTRVFEKTPPAVKDKELYLNNRIEHMKKRILKDSGRCCLLVKNNEDTSVGFFAAHQCNESADRVIIYTMSVSKDTSPETQNRIMSLLMVNALKSFKNAQSFWVAIGTYNKTTADELKALGYTESSFMDASYAAEKDKYQGYEVSTSYLKKRFS